MVVRQETANFNSRDALVRRFIAFSLLSRTLNVQGKGGGLLAASTAPLNEFNGLAWGSVVRRRTLT